MRFLYFSGLVALSAASAVDVDIRWYHEKSSGNTMITVFDSDTGKALAKSCGSYLQATTPIDFRNTNEDGQGNFTVGSETYLIHSVPTLSGGVACTRKYGGDAAVAECSGLTWSPAGARDSDEACPKNQGHHLLRRNLYSTEVKALRRSHSQHTSPIARGDGGPPVDDCENRYQVLNIGDGDPHQNYYDNQLTETQTCDQSDSCSVGQSESFTISVGFSTSTAGTPDWGWISGGFDVSISWGTTETHTCNGNPGETVCLWYNTAHTAYTVQRWNRCGDTVSDPYVMFSPNSGNSGGGFYCVVGTCQTKGAAYWDYSGRAGGP